MFGIRKRRLRPWMKIGAHCKIMGEGSTIFTIGELDCDTGCAMPLDSRGYANGWEGWEKLYRDNKCRRLDKKVPKNLQEELIQARKEEEKLLKQYTAAKQKTNKLSKALDRLEKKQ